MSRGIKHLLLGVAVVVAASFALLFLPSFFVGNDYLSLHISNRAGSTLRIVITSTTGQSLVDEEMKNDEEVDYLYHQNEVFEEESTIEFLLIITTSGSSRRYVIDGYEESASSQLEAIRLTISRQRDGQIVLEQHYVQKIVVGGR
jgi:hypothetical protein